MQAPSAIMPQGIAWLNWRAGPVANFVLTIAVFTGVVMWQGVPTERPTIGQIEAMPDGVAQPLMAGDVVLEVNGRPVAAFDDVFIAAIEMPEPGPMSFRIERDGSRIEMTAPYAFPAMVQGVEPLSPASRAGLMRGDVILSADGEPHCTQRSRNTLCGGTIAIRKFQSAPYRIRHGKR